MAAEHLATMRQTEHATTHSRETPSPLNASVAPLRVAFVITSMPVGGAETLLVNLIERMDPRVCVAEVICLKEKGPLGERLSDRVPVHANLLQAKYDLRVLPKLVQLMRSRKIDAVITVGSGDKMFWGRLAGKLAGVSVVCSALHSTGWPDGIGRLNRLLTPLTDGFIAVADAHAEFLRRVEKLGDQRVHTIRNGIDTERFCPSDEARRSVREELALDAATPLVGIVAALRPEKHHSLFLRMAKRVSERATGTHFLVIGDGPERIGLETLARELAIDDRVHFLGTRLDTPRWVAALDVFTLCSHNEAFPVSILEALACQVPVVSTRVGSVAEAVMEDETGYLVEPGDEEALSDRVIRLLEHPAEARRLGQQGRVLVQRTGSLHAMVHGYQDLVTGIYAKKRGTAGV